ncbi:4Fe-4S dicluster domain-containing protein [Butyrivibrio sp. MC2013]|uniref:4Fe-4S dicluster domain-containing protein n=1 Tax=Butyrivibrio sp. MC2013 TaxID=1280686 RepID=UPI00040AFF83|nr:4Fe-4S dicluster domain-containing protein [Butyrivibrio sp. MC2013]
MGFMTFKTTMLSNLFKKPVTTKYPAEPAVYPEGSRGHVVIEIEKCISCTICALNCPSGAIKVDRAARTWEINRYDCIQCGYCTLKCPKKCLHMAPGYQTPGPEKSIEHYDRPPEEEKPAAPAANAAATNAGDGK